MLDSGPIVGSFTVDGLTFAVTSESAVELVGVAPSVILSEGSEAAAPSATLSEAAEGGVVEGSDEGHASEAGVANLILPGFVTYEGADYALTSIAPYAFYLSGVTDVALPASVSDVDDRAFRSSDVANVAVADDNPAYSSYDGVLYDATRSSLLLIPGGRQGAVRISDKAEEVDASAFSHCAGVDAISVDADSAYLSSWEGLLYDADGTTLLRVPAGATEITIREGCTTIAAGALEACANLAAINAPSSVTSISPDVFTAIPTVSLPASSILADRAASPNNSPELEEASSSANAQITAIVALSSIEGDLPEVNPALVTAYVPTDADADVWKQSGFEVMYAAPLGSGEVETGELTANESELATLSESALQSAEAMKTVNNATGVLKVAGRNAAGGIENWVLDGTFDGIVSWPASAGASLPRVGAYGSGSATTPVTITVLELRDSVHYWENEVFDNANHKLVGFKVRPEGGSGSFTIKNLEAGSKFSFTLFANHIHGSSYANDNGAVKIESTNNPLLPVYANAVEVTSDTGTRTIQVWSRDTNGVTTPQSPLYGTFTGHLSWPADAGSDVPTLSRYGTAGNKAEVNIEIYTLQPFVERYWEDPVYHKEGYELTGFRVREGCGEGFISVEDLERGTGFSFMLYALSLGPNSTASASNTIIASSNWPLEPVHARKTASGAIAAWGYNAAGVPEGGNSVLDGSFSGTVSWPASYGDVLPAGTAADKAQAPITIKVDSYTSAHTKWNSTVFRKSGYELTGFRVRGGCGEGFISVNTLRSGGSFTVTFRASSLQSSSFYDAQKGSAGIYTSNYPFEPVHEKQSPVYFGQLSVFSKTAEYTDGGAVLDGSFFGSVSWPNGVAGDELPLKGDTPITVNVTSYTSSSEPWKEERYQKKGYALTGFQVREGCGEGFISVGSLQQGGPFSFTLLGLSMNTVSYLTPDGVARIQSGNWPLEPVFEYGANDVSGKLTVWSRSFDNKNNTNDAPIIDGAFAGSVSWPRSAGADLPRIGNYGNGSADTPVTISITSFTTSIRGWQNDTYFKKDNTSVLEGFRVREGCGSGFITVEMLEKGLPFSVILNARYLQASCYVKPSGEAFILSSDFPLEPVYSYGAYRSAGTIKVWSYTAEGKPGGNEVIKGSFSGGIAWPSSAGPSLPRAGNYGSGTKDTAVTLMVESFEYASRGWEQAVFQRTGYALIGFQVRTGCGGGYVSVADLQSGKPFRLTINAEYINSISNTLATGATFETRANPLEPVYTATSVKCTFAANNGTDESYETYSPWGGYVAQPPDIPQKIGYVFGGWYDAATEGNKVTSTTLTPTVPTTYYAHWVPVLSADVPLEVTARVDVLGIEDQTTATGYIESRCGEPLKVASVEFASLPGATELFGAGNESQVRLQVLAGEGAAWQPDGANAAFSFPLGASATESDAGKLAALTMQAYEDRVPISYRFAIPEALLSSLAETTKPVCSVAYTVALVNTAS
ncbi:MAG: leucine-rich repeat protein [Eggerthellaceae bacterium]|nr:leucine-rich repeat protein [Eggerthellaceae bacterium]